MRWATSAARQAAISAKWDQTAGFQYNRARYYDPQLGRWTQEDPISFAAGNLNLYRYVGNGAANFIDPSGLDSLHIAAGPTATLPTIFSPGGFSPEARSSWVSMIRYTKP